MPRSRNIKPGLFKNEILGEADPIYSLLFAGLWTLADKSGRLENRPKRIKAEIFPYRSMLDPCMALAWLMHESFITMYEINGNSYIQINTWADHQSPHHKEVESSIPAINDADKVLTKQEVIDACVMHGSCMDQAWIKESASSPLIPDSLLLIPDSLNLIPDSQEPEQETAKKTKPKKPKTKAPSKTGETWKRYADAYHNRYNVDPVRNARVNGQMAKFVDCVGAEEAPHIAAFYVNHNNGFYVTKMHAVGILLVDAEKIRTEWATNSTSANREVSIQDRAKQAAERRNNRRNSNGSV